jgi:superfamily I DNA/RNA helicase
MSTKGFTGGAGTGKTTSLLRELDAHLATNPLADGQRVLALTFMHGSRHRLAERLAKSSARRHFECMTLDRFAWDICRRWRSRLRSSGGLVPLDMDAPD